MGSSAMSSATSQSMQATISTHQSMQDSERRERQALAACRRGADARQRGFVHGFEPWYRGFIYPKWPDVLVGMHHKIRRREAERVAAFCIRVRSELSIRHWSHRDSSIGVLSTRLVMTVKKLSTPWIRCRGFDALQTLQ